MEKELTPKKFSLMRRAKSLTHAWRGIEIMVRSTHNAWLECLFSLIIVCMGFYFHITQIEWILAIFAVGFVLAAEAFNTAIEIDINLTSPEYHPYARDTKDVAAGAVLISGITAFVIWGLIFAPYILKII